MFQVGDRVKTKARANGVYCFTVPEGSLGTVVEVKNELIYVEQDIGFISVALEDDLELISRNYSLPNSNQKLSDPSTWKEEGRCPKCGELGPFCPRTWVPTCSKHGEY